MRLTLAAGDGPTGKPSPSSPKGGTSNGKESSHRELLPIADLVKIGEIG